MLPKIWSCLHLLKDSQSGATGRALQTGSPADNLECGGSTATLD